MQLVFLLLLGSSCSCVLMIHLEVIFVALLVDIRLAVFLVLEFLPELMTNSSEFLAVEHFVVAE